MQFETAPRPGSRLWFLPPGGEGDGGEPDAPFPDDYFLVEATPTTGCTISPSDGFSPPVAACDIRWAQI